MRHVRGIHWACANNHDVNQLDCGSTCESLGKNTFMVMTNWLNGCVVENSLGRKNTTGEDLDQ